ncbi:unnamed protein product [Ostreobium quekettii]|uniref:Alcohol dehydrogenase-like C-terminal domain-containing protein n=1 Tax=Ostreobium quekettii TaxID=121088 RepID=A0A8S1J3S2_9CHLO|nr:unnamed protein product [Ostreobium quekettii]
MKPNEKVLVTAAAGGTGHFAVQLAKMQGCHVVATCGGADKAKALERLGLDRVIDYKRESVGGVLREEYPNGIDLVYEGVGGAMLRTCLDGLAPRGRLILVGYIAEYPHSKDCALSGRPIGDGLPCAADLFWGGTTIERDRQTIYGGVMPKDPQDIQRCRAKVFRLYEEGRLSAWIDRSNRYVGLESIPDAIDGMLKGGHIGKVVVEI